MLKKMLNPKTLGNAVRDSIFPAIVLSILVFFFHGKIDMEALIIPLYVLGIFVANILERVVGFKVN